MITTNKSVKDWPEILAGDEVMATALLDRLLHHCHVLNIKGRSYRLRDLERALAGGGGRRRSGSDSSRPAGSLRLRHSVISDD